MTVNSFNNYYDKENNDVFYSSFEFLDFFSV